jgi:hypothetical protein
MTKFSDNGWPGVPDKADLAVCDIPGTDLHFRLAHGGPDWILTEFARRFNEEVEPLVGNRLDDWSWAYRDVRGSTTSLSCHASGTAIDLNALSHPRGVHNTFSAAKEKKLRALLADFVDPTTGISVIKWGKDFKAPSIVDEMHFQIRGTANDLARVETKLRAAEVPMEDTVDPKEVWTVPKFKEYGDQNGDKVREEYTPAEILWRVDSAVQRLEKALAALINALAAK